MTIGKEVGAFTSSTTSMTKTTDNAGNHTFAMNVEGTLTGGLAGTALGTITGTTANFQVGSFTADFAAYLADGSVVTGLGSGQFGLAGTHNWQMNGTATLSNGARVATEGVLDLANRSYNGKMFEIT
jgi:hypothetical protein